MKNVQGWKLSTNVRSVVKAFPGAKVEGMFHYIKPTLNQQPDEIILHVGTNDVKHLTPRAIAERIVDLGNNIVSECPNTKVTISNLLCRSDDGLLNANVKEVNKVLNSFARQNQWKFLTHSNINNSHLNASGLHLNRNGSRILLSNFSRHISN